jgi:AcrR family transcriptional regulator
LDNGNVAAKSRPARRRDPDGTRLAILEAARILLAKDGPEGLSVSQVAQLAGVNRGTAYQHFQTREQLLKATAAWVSEKLCLEVFGNPALSNENARGDPWGVAQHLSEFAMENTELGRVWLFEVLSSSRPASDPFWKQYKKRFEEFAKTDFAQSGIDIEVLSVIMIIGAFLWPVWAGAHAKPPKERQQLARRYASEIVRLSMYGTLHPEYFPEIAAELKKIPAGAARGRGAKTRAPAED